MSKMSVTTDYLRELIEENTSFPPEGAPRTRLNIGPFHSEYETRESNMFNHWEVLQQDLVEKDSLVWNVLEQMYGNNWMDYI
jgi:hypothetical protein